MLSPHLPESISILEARSVDVSRYETPTEVGEAQLSGAFQLARATVH